MNTCFDQIRKRLSLLLVFFFALKMSELIAFILSVNKVNIKLVPFLNPQASNPNQEEHSIVFLKKYLKNKKSSKNEYQTYFETEKNRFIQAYVYKSQLQPSSGKIEYTLHLGSSTGWMAERLNTWYQLVPYCLCFHSSYSTVGLPSIGRFFGNNGRILDPKKSFIACFFEFVLIILFKRFCSCIFGSRL